MTEVAFTVLQLDRYSIMLLYNLLRVFGGGNTLFACYQSETKRRKREGVFGPNILNDLPGYARSESLNPQDATQCHKLVNLCTSVKVLIRKQLSVHVDSVASTLLQCIDYLERPAQFSNRSFMVKRFRVKCYALSLHVPTESISLFFCIWILYGLRW